jgi:hypothetical protein
VSRSLQEGVGGSAIGWSADCGQGGLGNVRTRSTGFRVDLGTRYVTVCVAGKSGGKLSAVFLQPIQNRGLYRTEE